MLIVSGFRVNERKKSWFILGGLVLGLPLFLGLAYPKASAAPVALSDHSLSAITAGSSGDSLSNPSFSPLSRSMGQTSKVDEDGPGATPGLDNRIAIESAILKIYIFNAVKQAGSQVSLRAGNLVNVSGADSGNGLNIIDQSTAIVQETGSRAIEQVNAIVQNHSREGGLGYFAVLGHITEESTQFKGFENGARTVTFFKELIDRNQFLTETVSEMNVTVDQKGIFEDGIGIGPDSVVLIPDFSITLPDFGFNGIETVLNDLGDIIRRDGARHGTVSGVQIQFSGSQLDLGDIKLQGDDIVIGPSTLTIPSFSIGQIIKGDELCRGLLCFFSENFTVGQVSDTNTITFGGRTIEGVNPIPGITGYGGGFAFVGTGEIKSDPGGVNIQASLPMDLGTFGPGKFVEFVIPWRSITDKDGRALDGGKDVRIRLPVGDKLLPTITLELDLDLDLAFPPGFTGTFEGAVCFAMEDCGEMSISKREYAYVENSRTEFETVEETASKNYERIETSKHTGSVMAAGGKGELLTLRSSSADEEKYNIVIVSEGAQSQIRVLNGVNASGAVVGNGINIGVSKSGTKQNSGLSGSRLSQRNTFVQIGGQ